MFRLTKHALTALLCIGTLVSTSCNKGNDKDSTNIPSNSQALRIAVLPIWECDILRHAKESGMADDMGLNIDLITYDALMDMDTAILSHAADVYFEDSLRICRIQDDSIRPSMLLPIAVKFSLIANKDKNITSVKALRTNMVGLTRWSQLEKFASETTKSAGLGEMDVYHAQINSIPLRTSMTSQGLIDAAVIPYPWADTLKSTGHYVLKETILSGMGFFVSPSAQNDTIKQIQLQQLKKLYLEALKQATK